MRSMSPVPIKHKRSWQNVSGDRFDRDDGRMQLNKLALSPDTGGGRNWNWSSLSPDRGERRDWNRSLTPDRGGRRDWNQSSPARGGRNDFQLPSKSIDRRNLNDTSGSLMRQNLSSPIQKRPQARYNFSGRAPASSHARLSQQEAGVRSRSVTQRRNDRFGSALKPRPFPRRVPVSTKDNRIKGNASNARRISPHPNTNSPTKEKPLNSTSTMGPPAKRARSRSPISSTQIKKDTSTMPTSNSIPQRKVVTGSKKKVSTITLHKRFTFEDQDPFELTENVTIAILRKPDAQASEDVTVKKIFDASQFKMIHKKTEGKKPIFDREEIKVWRHDENLADDPDYERRLVRVKATSEASKSTSEGLPQMPPDLVRKAIGLQASGKSNQSKTEPRIRLDPKPDPRYEAKFKQQLEREQELGKLKTKNETNRTKVDNESSGSNKVRDKGVVKERRREDEKKGGRGKEETYDLRQALERRRSDREEGSFRIEVKRNSNSKTELFYRDDQHGARSNVEQRRFVQDTSAVRNVVLDEDRIRRRIGGSVEKDAGQGWRSRKFSDDVGRVERTRDRYTEWIIDRDGRKGGGTDFREGGGNFERRQKFSISPTSTRGWRTNNRSRGRGFFRGFTTFNQDLSPTEINDSFKYSQHDDRDVSPKNFGRGGRGRYGLQNFGSNNFRAVGRGRRGFRGGYRSGGFMSQGDNRSVVRHREMSTDREWKHDMYDSLLVDDEQPHSTTLGI